MTSGVEELRDQYRMMQTIRRFEEESARAYAMGKIGGFLHLYIGQEAVAVGVNAVLKEQDFLFQTYRDHGTAIARGMSPDAAMAELFGKDTGCSRGLGGSMHFFDAERHFLGGWGIVGGHLAVAAGAAFQSKYLGKDAVTVAFLGEGATNIGGFHEALSLAGLWKLPIVFIVENNQYAMGTPMSRTTPLSDLSEKARGYGMHGDHFEGHDVAVVKERVGQAVERARRGEGPTFIEIETYRFRGHSMSDPAKYRSRAELEERKKKDPVAIARRRLLEAGIKQEAIDEIDEEVDEVVDAAVKSADAAEPAKEEVMWSTVYAPSFGLGEVDAVEPETEDSDA